MKVKNYKAIDLLEKSLENKLVIGYKSRGKGYLVVEPSNIRPVADGVKVHSDKYGAAFIDGNTIITVLEYET